MIKKIVENNWVYMLLILIVILIFNHVMNSEAYSKIIEMDNNFFSIIEEFRSDFLTVVFKIFTTFGNIYIPLVILVCLLVFFKNKWIFLLQSSSYAIAGLITYLAKIIVARPRPMTALIKIPSSYSFPSGHTLTSIIFYVMLVYLLSYNSKKEVRNALIVIASVFSLCIAFSRPYLGVHFLSDILGGIILGVPILLVLINIVNKIFNKKLSGK